MSITSIPSRVRSSPPPAITAAVVVLPAPAPLGQGEGTPSKDALILLTASCCFNGMLRVYGPDHRQTNFWRVRAIEAASLLIASGASRV